MRAESITSPSSDLLPVFGCPPVAYVHSMDLHMVEKPKGHLLRLGKRLAKTCKPNRDRHGHWTLQLTSPTQAGIKLLLDLERREEGAVSQLHIAFDFLTPTQEDAEKMHQWLLAHLSQPWSRNSGDLYAGHPSGTFYSRRCPRGKPPNIQWCMYCDRLSYTDSHTPCCHLELRVTGAKYVRRLVKVAGSRPSTRHPDSRVPILAWDVLLADLHPLVRHYLRLENLDVEAFISAIPEQKPWNHYIPWKLTLRDLLRRLSADPTGQSVAAAHLLRRRLGVRSKAAFRRIDTALLFGTGPPFTTQPILRRRLRIKPKRLVERGQTTYRTVTSITHSHSQRNRRSKMGRKGR